jgi:nucleotide-binding universal stress UspA family protein
MVAFSHVVVGLDGSEAACHALRWISSRVSPTGLDVVHAGTLDPAVPDDITCCSIRSTDMAPADLLIALAHETGADAIVIGPHGSGFGRGLGRVARQLLNQATVPVIVVGEPEPPRSLDLAPPVVACVGYGEPATAAAEWAASYADKQQLPLVLLHSVAYRPIFPFDAASDVLASYLGTGVSIAWAQDELRELAQELAVTYPDLEISTHVDSTSVIRSVRNAGETAELVVLGKRSGEEFLHALGTPRLRRLVARADFPTAVVPCPSSD